MAVAFTPMLAVRELGVAMPEAGGEAAWFKENAEYFKEQSQVKGDETFKAMLEEVETREDLKKMVEGGGLSGLLEGMKVGGSQGRENGK